MNKELNEYIKHYLEKDKTRRAIMLSGAWGTGKSFYIQNILKPYLDQFDTKLVVVSLYGLKDLRELNKAIYLEIRAKTLAKKSEKLSVGKLIGKTIIKGVAGFFNVDLSMSEKDLQRLYASIDLKGKLIILEDLERSNIDIFDILGYVNSLVEQDRVKVLLVANEDEILQYEEVQIQVSNENEKSQTIKTEKRLTEISKMYLREKEKTVGDTILFIGDIKGAMESIMESYKNPIFNSLLGDIDALGRHKIADEIYETIMKYKGIECENLRAFIYACQKTVDIFDSVNNKLDSGFAKQVFLSVVAFSLRKSKYNRLGWGDDSDYSLALGTNQYPLLHYCYLNIIAQYSYPEEFIHAEKKWIAQKELDEQQEKSNSSLRAIYNYSEQREADLINAIKHVKELLRKPNGMHPSQYGKLASHLIAIKYILNCDKDVDECKRLIIENIKQTTDEDLIRDFSIYRTVALSKEASLEIESFSEEASKATNFKAQNLFDFDYSIECLVEFCKQVHKNRDFFVIHRAFARKIDNDKLVGLLSKCSASQISEIRGLYLTVYSFSNIDEFFMDDRDTLIDLKDKLCEFKNSIDCFDKIQLLQLQWFIENLNEILSKLHA